MAVTREQLLQASETIGSISAELQSAAGKVPSAIQGSGADKVPGVMESVSEMTSTLSKAIEAANRCRQIIRNKVSWMEANGVASLQWRDQATDGTSLAGRIAAGVAIPFVALAPGVARARDMQSDNVNDMPAIYEELPCAIETPEDAAERYANENGWTIVVDGIEMGIDALASAKKRRDEQH